MPVTAIHKDPANLTMTVEAEFAAPVERVWNAYADPRQLEKFWGPPGWPATFERHDFAPGGRSAYYMTGPNGEKSRGYWEFVRVDAPTEFEVLDGFAQDNGAPNPNMPAMRMHVKLLADGARTKVVFVSTFSSLEAMETVLKMGMEEGLRAALNQADALFAA
ncbi:MAG: SRPBCC domain-containing protein [Vicinamibacterales bacterium]